MSSLAAIVACEGHDADIVSSWNSHNTLVANVAAACDTRGSAHRRLMNRSLGPVLVAVVVTAGTSSRTLNVMPVDHFSGH
jgi:hypothetical protein